MQDKDKVLAKDSEIMSRKTIKAKIQQIRCQDKERIWNRCFRVWQFRRKGYSGREIAKRLDISYTIIKVDFKRLDEVGMLPKSTAKNGRPKK